MVESSTPQVVPMNVSPHKPSYEVNTMNLKIGPLHRRLLAYYNEMHEAIAGDDFQTISELEEIVPALLEEFEATECKGAPSPGWIAGKMRGGWHVAKGDFETALKFEFEGYQHAANEQPSAENSRRISVSSSNIADQLWRLGRPADALSWALRSVELWSSNTINHLVLGIVAYHAGIKAEANKTFEHLRKVARFHDEHDVLSKCMKFERELHALVELPAVQDLLKAMGADTEVN